MKNLPFVTTPVGITEGIDFPLGRRGSSRSKVQATKQKMTVAQAKELLASDFDLFHACLLARFKTLPLPVIQAIDVRVALGGCEGFLQSLQDEFGVVFDITNACGELAVHDEATSATKRNSAYQRWYRDGIKKKTFQTIVANHGVTMSRGALQQDTGIGCVGSLTGKGAKALMVLSTLGLSNRELLDRIQFVTDESRVDLRNNLHSQQVACFVAQLIVGVVNANDRQLQGLQLLVDLAALNGEQDFNFETSRGKHTFRPDASGVITFQVSKPRPTSGDDIKSLGVGFYLENDTGTMTKSKKDAIYGKVLNYLLYMIDRETSGQGSWVKPVLLLVAPSAVVLKKYEPEVAKAFQFASDYLGYTNDAVDFGRVAFTTHEVLRSNRTPLGSNEGGVWQLWDNETHHFSAEQFTLMSLARKKPTSVAAGIRVPSAASHS